MKKILVLAEHDNQQLKPATLNVISAANAIKATIIEPSSANSVANTSTSRSPNEDPIEITLLIAGNECEALAEHSRTLPGISQVVVFEGESLKHLLAETLVPAIAKIAGSYRYILAPSTTFGKNILPRLAALLEVGQLSDVLQVISEDTFIRPMYAGNVLATVQSFDPIKLLTIRTTAFEPIFAEHNSSPVPIEKIAIAQDNEKLSTFLRTESSPSLRPELTAAHIVVSGGRGLQSAENFKLLEDIADKLGAAVGASRAAVDAGFVPNDYQIGQTGKIVAPDLYIAVGISGAIQHLAGMKDSKVIVAINKDPDAPIFQVADYSLVGDLFQILPELSQELSILNK